MTVTTGSDSESFLKRRSSDADGVKSYLILIILMALLKILPITCNSHSTTDEKYFPLNRREKLITLIFRDIS